MTDLNKFNGLDISGNEEIPIKEENKEEYIYEYKQISSCSDGKSDLISIRNDSVDSSCLDALETKFKKHIFCCDYCTQIFFSRRSFKEHLKFDHYETVFVKHPIISKIKLEVSDSDYIESEISSSECTINNIKQVKNKKDDNPELDFRIRNPVIIKRHVNSLHSIEKLNYHASGQKILIVPTNSLPKPIVNSCVERLKRYSCPECGFKTAHQTSVRRHINIVHAKNKRHSCDQCDYRTYMLRQLKLHIAAKHSKDKAFKCSMCEYSSVQARYLKRHVTAVHTDEGRQPCPFCDFSTVYVEYLKHHIRAKHTNERPYVCPYCDHSFALSGHMNNHILSVHKKIKRHTCQECDYQCTLSGDMRRHVNARHSKKQFPCPYCNYRSATIYQLKSHIKAMHHKL